MGVAGRDYRPVWHEDEYEREVDYGHGTLCWWLGFFLHWIGILIGAIISGGYGAKKAALGWMWSFIWWVILVTAGYLLLAIASGIS